MKKSLLKLPMVQPDWSLLRFPEYGHELQTNGSNLYMVQSNKPGLCFLEMVFRNGRWGERKKLSARMAANQILEGTEAFNSEQVADLIDFHGAHVSVHADLDFTVISLSCLQKHFNRLAELLVELILHPAYRNADLEKAKIFLKSQLQHQLTEPDFVSYREFTSMVYGKDNVYGYNSETELIENLNREDLFLYQKENYCAEFLNVFYCGETSAAYVNFLKKLLSAFPKRPGQDLPVHDFEPYKASTVHFPIEHCHQISLKMGKRMFLKKHPDFFGMYFLNTILGDYFGSRLMKNIREDKGYTYDIHSTLDAQIHNGCFYISAELNPGQKDHSLELIRQELNRLRTELISDHELELVKNYLCGNLLRLMDGSFQTIIFLKILVMEYGESSAFENLLTEILNIEPVRLKELAVKYLDPDEMILVTAGA